MTPPEIIYSQLPAEEFNVTAQASDTPEYILEDGSFDPDRYDMEQG